MYYIYVSKVILILEPPNHSYIRFSVIYFPKNNLDNYLLIAFHLPYAFHRSDGRVIDVEFSFTQTPLTFHRVPIKQKLPSQVMKVECLLFDISNKPIIAGLREME